MKTKKLLIVLLVAVIMLTMSTKIFAAVDFSGLVGDDDTQINVTQTEPDTQTQVTPTPTTTDTPTTNTTTVTNETKLPQTGDASDYLIFAVVAVCIVISVVAYKKVRDYNNI